MEHGRTRLPAGKPIAQAKVRQIVEIHCCCLTLWVSRVHLVGQGIRHVDRCQGRERLGLTEAEWVVMIGQCFDNTHR